MINKTGMIFSTLLNGLLFLLLLVGSVGIVMGLAASGSGFAQFLLVAYYLFFAVPIISIIGSWLSYKNEHKKMMWRFMALPWVYSLLYAIGLAALFAIEKQ